MGRDPSSIGSKAEYLGLTVDELSATMRAKHRATVLAVNRNGTSNTNPDAGFRVEAGDDLVVVAEGLGDLVPLQEASALA